MEKVGVVGGKSGLDRGEVGVQTLDEGHQDGFPGAYSTSERAQDRDKRRP
jgi:hypothetical protein